MGYYVRVLSTSAEHIPLADLQAGLQQSGLKGTLVVEEGTPENWTALLLSHAEGEDISTVERDLVEPGSLASEELEEFAEEAAHCEPVSAANWLAEYFPRVRCIYAFQVLEGADELGWQLLQVVQNQIASTAPSIFQADHEGFSNEEGCHILWQFNDSAEGESWMAVLKDGSWKPFQMDLADLDNRESFLQGEIPEKAKLG